MGSVNFIAVKAYGEFEFWFALIKIVTIVLMIISSLGMILFGLASSGGHRHRPFVAARRLYAQWRAGHFDVDANGDVCLSGRGDDRPDRWRSKNPRKTLARAVDSVFWRILIFMSARCLW